MNNQKRIDHGIKKIKELLEKIQQSYNDYYTRNYQNALLDLQTQGERIMSLVEYYKYAIGADFFNNQFMFTTLRKNVAYYYRYYNQTKSYPIVI